VSSRGQRNGSSRRVGLPFAHTPFRRGSSGEHVDAVCEHPSDVPCWIPLANLESGCAPTEPVPLPDGAPALVTTSETLCRHCFAAHDIRKWESAASRLQCEVANASRILPTFAERVTQLTKTAAESFGSVALHSQSGRFLVGTPNTVELFRDALDKQRSALTGHLHGAVANNFSSASLTSLAIEAAHTLALVNTTGGSDEAPWRAVSGITQPLQNILVLATSLALPDDDFALLRRSQGLTEALNQQLTNILLEAFPEASPRELELHLSRLGVAKYHLYTKGVKFSRRRKREKKSTFVEKADVHLLPLTDPSCDSASAACHAAENLLTGCAR